MKDNTVVVIIQARMGSQRLPGKTMADLCGKPMLSHVIERVSISLETTGVVIATTTDSRDDEIAEFAEKFGVPCTRGSETDVLSRFYHTMQLFPAEAYVRITADCPLIDPHIIDATVRIFKDGDFRYATSASSVQYGHSTYPRGLDCEVFKAALLKEAHENSAEAYEREHVTPYMYLKQKSIGYHENPRYIEDVSVSKLRWTVDTPQDIAAIRQIYDGLYHGKHDFFYEDILDYVKAHPGISELNKDITQKTLF